MDYRDRTGWSLIELAIVVVIIGILAALAIPLFALIVKKSRFSTLANDLRTHAEAFQNYAMEEGDYPESYGSSGSFVPGMEDLLSTKWLEPSPVGGVYTWEYSQPSAPQSSQAWIEISQTGSSPFAIDITDLASLDEEIDDGNLSTGYLQAAGTRIRYFLKLDAN